MAEEAVLFWVNKEKYAPHPPYGHFHVVQTDADFLAHAGIKTYIDAAHAIAHNKVMIIDEQIVAGRQGTGKTETLDIPGITAEVRYRLQPGEPEVAVRVIPSLIYYSETETLIGDQVLSRGLAEHPDTFRWMKRGIAQRVAKRKKTAQGHKSPAQAGEDFLSLLVNYASDQISLADDEFTFTAPTEAFEDFQDWLRRVCEGLGIRRLRMLDEPTACVLGYHGAARRDDRFVVFDFGCGTLDVSAVRIDLAAHQENKAVQLGKAGRDRCLRQEQQ